jgi:UDP-N-acetylmuramoylalanine--D-glutamate ligase
METALFAKHTKAKVVGITGTRGKSSTTMMIYQTLSALYKVGKVYLAGNVPDTCALELLDVAARDDIVVLELSSWQLSGFHLEHISPHIAVFTNFYPDHLNYYKTMSEYLHDKDAIFAYQKPGDVYIDGRELPPGSHHTQNRACARACCIAVLGERCGDDIEKQLNNFKSLPYRQQLIGTYHQVQIINDTTSTTPIALITALRTFIDKPIVLIMGGQAKNLPIDELVTEIRQNAQIRQVFHMPGTFTDQVREKVGGEVYEDFTQLVQRSLQSADELHQQCYLLFSPGATSFAQFKNEFDRGQAFDKAISAIIF